ncbi:hypothetical protein AB0L85_17640 [Streptomyces sp. NPDC052051]|uniref:hypothetical protein n=1 Tax=Streptomyces sp. NPDC052051 TaxID=3154649 RepID=UPI00342796A8
MSDRHVLKMLRQMASGRWSVEVAPAMATTKEFARLAAIAQQFGYEYAGIRRGSGYVMSFVPDLGPQARARAAHNWAQYPHASDGGARPPLAPEAIDLLKARITFDMSALYGNQVLRSIGLVGALLVFGLLRGTTPTVFAGIACAVLVVGVPLGLAVNRHRRAKCTALLQAAGFIPMTDRNGRLRYVPPGQLPGYGDPNAGRA